MDIQGKRAFQRKYEIIEEGQNGRCLPVLPREEKDLARMFEPLLEEDALITMLGTNDILLTNHPDAEKAIRKMDDFLDWLINKNPHPQMTVIGPVPISNVSSDMQAYFDESIRMNAGFEALCKSRGVPYFNAADWDVELAYDGVHFTENGCARFAERMIEVIQSRFSPASR